MEEFSSFIRNTRNLIIGEIISFALSFGINFFLIRFLSVKDYGNYNLILTVPVILLYIADFGLYHGCSYYVARLGKLNKKEQVRNVIKITLVTKSLIGIGLAMTIYFLAEKFVPLLLGTQNHVLIPLVQLASILLVTKNLLEAVNSILIGSIKMNFFIILLVIQNGTIFVITIFLVLLGWNLFGPVVGLVIATGIAGLMGLFYIRKNLLRYNGKKQSIDWKCLPKVVKRGFSYSLISVIHNVRYEVFIIFLAIFGFYTEVSYLKVGVGIFAIFYVILRPVMISLFPIFSRYSWKIQTEKTILNQIFQYSIKFCILFISPLIIFCIIFASELVPLVFGLNYLAGSQFISVFLIYFLPLTIGMVAVPSFFFSQGYQNLAFLIEFFSFSVSILLGICFSLFLGGGFGFAIGIPLGAILGLIFGILMTNQKFGKELFSKTKESILIIVIAGLLCGLLFGGFYLFNLMIVLENPILKLLIIGGIFVCFYILLLIVLIRVNLIRYQEISYLIQEFQNIPIFNRILHFIFIIGKKLWKKKDDF
ncbi:MAG: oligosaccharide flippase family protein [Promethearchaeota archaeon]